MTINAENLPKNVGINLGVNWKADNCEMSHSIHKVCNQLLSALQDIEDSRDASFRAQMVKVSKQITEYVAGAINNKVTYGSFEQHLLARDGIEAHKYTNLRKDNLRKDFFEADYNFEKKEFENAVRSRNAELRELIEINETCLPGLEKAVSKRINNVHLELTLPFRKIAKSFSDFSTTLEKVSQSKNSPVSIHQTYYVDINLPLPSGYTLGYCSEPSWSPTPLTTSCGSWIGEVPRFKDFKFVMIPDSPTERVIWETGANRKHTDNVFFLEFQGRIHFDAFLSISYDVGYGNILGVCCGPDWQTPTPLKYDQGQWVGEIAPSKDFKFVILQQDANAQWKIAKWESGENHQVESGRLSLNLSSDQIRF